MFGRAVLPLSGRRGPGSLGKQISRRDLLRLGGGLALGAGLVPLSGCGSSRSARRTVTTLAPATSGRAELRGPALDFTPPRSRSGSTEGADLRASS